MKRSLLFALALMGPPAAAAAQTASQDRYGPPERPDPLSASAELSPARSAAPSPAQAPRYAGPFLTWTGKLAQPLTEVSSASPQVVAPRAEYAPRPAPLARIEAAASLYSPQPAAFAAPARRDRAPAPLAPREKPASLSSRQPTAVTVPVRRGRSPAPLAATTPAEPEATAPPHNVTAALASRPASPKATMPIAAPPAPVPEEPPVVMAAAAAPAIAGTTVRARFYSLHRAYGDQPDAVRIPTERPPVLIGPSDTSSPAADDASETKSEKAGGLF
jgi:hypothetical protein